MEAGLSCGGLCGLGVSGHLFSGGAGRPFVWSLRRLDRVIFRVSLSFESVFAFSHLPISLFSRTWQHLRKNSKCAGSSFSRERKKWLCSQQKGTTPGSVGDSHGLTFAPRGSLLGSVLLSLNSVWFSSHFSHRPTEQTRVDQFGVLILSFKFMRRANRIFVHLRGEFSELTVWSMLQFVWGLSSPTRD